MFILSKQEVLLWVPTVLILLSFSIIFGTINYYRLHLKRIF